MICQKDGFRNTALIISKFIFVNANMNYLAYVQKYAINYFDLNN